MTIYIALLRGINVGGKNKLPMKDLSALIADLGGQQIKTYIQSGNAVFRHQTSNSIELSRELEADIRKTHEFEPRVLLLSMSELAKAVARNPFPAAEADPKTLHLYFLAAIPQHPDIESLEVIKGDRETFQLDQTIFYLHAPNGIGRSKLAAKAEKLLGVTATARNWRTVSKLMRLAESISP